MNKEDESKLKLIGKNQEDLRIISAYSQDSIVNLKDIVFLKKNRTFVMIVNRFMWEDLEKGVFRENKRIRCALKFEEVLSVESKNINQNNINRLLEFLAIKCNTSFDETYKIKIFFSGDCVITINVETLDVVMHDLGKSWIVKHMPKHKI